MQLSMKCSVAVHCLIFIHEYHGSAKVTSNLLSLSTGINPVVIRNILSGLKKAGIITVPRGTGGAQPVSYTHLFAGLADDVNSIADGLHNAVESELKSERMKSELITNVSHDIRTPLTSIITYADLLQKEGLESPNASRYCQVIDQKAQRLKMLTDDLFEVSKAASGNIQVDLAPVELCSLIRQGMGELSDKMEQSGLDLDVYKRQFLHREAPCR